MQLQTVVLVAFLLGSSTSAKNILQKSRNGPSNVDDLNTCADAIREVKMPMVSRVSDLQKELYSSVTLLKAELAVMRKTHEAGLLELKNTLLIQTHQRQRNIARADSIFRAMARRLKKNAGSNTAAVAQMRREVMKEVRQALSEEGKKIADSNTAAVAQMRREVVKEVRQALREEGKKIADSNTAAVAQMRREVLSETAQLRKNFTDCDLAKPRPQTNATCTANECLIRRVSTAVRSVMAEVIAANLTRLASSSRQPSVGDHNATTSRPDQQRPRANATDAGQEVEVRRLLRLLDCNNTANVSADKGLLSELKDCAEAKAIERFRAEGEFRLITTHDLDVSSSGELIGALPLKACGAECVRRGDSCRGVHVSAKGQCTIFTMATATWSENATQEATVWVRRSEGRNCSAANFPHSLGRSRYRVVNDEMTWPAARRACERLGGKLAQISSIPEWRLVSNRIHRYGSRRFYYVGLYQLPGASEPRGGWVWYPSNDPFEMSDYWYGREPGDTSGIENNACLSSGYSQFHDVVGSRQHLGSVCECFVV